MCVQSELQAALEKGDREARRRLARSVLFVVPGNLVERPWGGRRLAGWTGVPDRPPAEVPFGESFEVAADPSDPEAGAHPSRVRLPDGSEMALADLLALAPEEVLGAAALGRGGARITLLPKLLDVREMLSVQAHPPGSPELYVVLDADPGATIRLGFRRDADAGALEALWRRGREAQEQLLALAAGKTGPEDLQRALAPGLADPGVPPETLVQALLPLVGAGLGDALAGPVATLAGVVRETLSLLAEVPVRAGDVLWNATPPDLAPAAEVHALGNERGRGILLFEVRRTGPTLRMWDHGRFPLRPLQTAAALCAVSPRARTPDSFRVTPTPLPGAPGVQRLVASRAFTVDLLAPLPGRPVRLEGTGALRTLHGLSGEAALLGAGGETLGGLGRGRSVLLPAGLGAVTIGTEKAGTRVLAVSPGAPPEPGDPRRRNLEDLRRIVDRSEGPSDVIALVNGGDGEAVGARLGELVPDLFRRDGLTRIHAHEEEPRRGQLLGLLDAWRVLGERGTRPDAGRVALGLMMPGQGTRLSPLTQRLHGIKPFLPLPMRHPGGSAGWWNAAAASLATWTLVARHLERLGFRGVAWKWGDEPQIPARVLADLDLDLSEVDAVRFGAEVEVTEDLARHKEWLLGDPATGLLRRQVRRRPRADLARVLGVPADRPFRALVHVGSPALSTLFLDEAEALFRETPGVLDVDGWLFEALTTPPDAWQEEVHRDPGLGALLDAHPDFPARARELARRIASRRGHPLRIQVIDFGAGLYWADLGQLDKARRAFAAVGAGDADGRLARDLAGLSDLRPDRWGNRVLASTGVPGDGSLRDSVVLESRLAGGVRGRGAVVVSSQLGTAALGPGAVVVESTVLRLEAGARSFSFRSVGELFRLPDGGVHTSIPVDPTDVARGLESWRADVDVDPGAGERWSAPQWGNPASFAEKHRQVRRRTRPLDRIETEIEELWRAPLRRRMA